MIQAKIGIGGQTVSLPRVHGSRQVGGLSSRDDDAVAERYLGIDVGSETIRVVELERAGGTLRLGRRLLAEHHKEPLRVALDLLRHLDWDGVAGAAVSGRFSRLFDLAAVPTKQAQAAGFRMLHPGEECTIVSIGSHGFSVLELRPSGMEVFRENSRCSQGTGNFLRQLVERFGLTIEEASALCEDVADPLALSGRCPVILKTDMTHLANKGEDRPRVLAGLYDAVCENVQVLVKPALCPARVLLVGGVSRAQRVREHFRRFLERHGMELLPGDDCALYLEAIGCAAIALRSGRRGAPPLGALHAVSAEMTLDHVPPLAHGLANVRRLARPEPARRPGMRSVVLGLDIGSTGSKAVVIDRESRDVLWEGYLNTGGNPVGAAQELLRRFATGAAGGHALQAFGVTGSGREIVGSVLSTCYGSERVYVLNEIAAHAEGALHFDPRVDTVFEIGGQDAKYIRLVDGRVVDAAMNEACSAGTGSFIEEQGRRFSGVKDVVHLGNVAMEAASCVSLGRHCSVFMAEIIDEAVGAGEPSQAIIAGIYHSIVQNYMDRVKGNRSVGKVIFCQGMPFAADALASAVALRTEGEVIVPPNPGTVGALGIALLAGKALPAVEGPAAAPEAFLEARVIRRDAFVCKSKKGCGGAGNRCRIDRITTAVFGAHKRFTWGGACSLWDRAAGRQKLPDLAPNPFRERDDLVRALVRGFVPRTGQARVALTDEFLLKGMFPFFGTFLYELGFDLLVRSGADRAALKRGIAEANISYCAPMQQYHGMISALSEEPADYVFLPMMRSAPRVGDEPYASVCPIVQASPDVLRWDLGPKHRERVVSPVIDVGSGNLESAEFLRSCCDVARSLGVQGNDWRRAHRVAMRAQSSFERRCAELGARALDFCREEKVVPVIVLGRPYTIYNTVLNSNVPSLLREQGALPIPVDCYPVGTDVPVFPEMFWSHGQRNLRAAQQVRHTDGLYSMWCSNYSCGPDSFNLHFYGAVMEGKPFAVVETDGHSGDAGTKTRVEAFLHCVREDLAAHGRAERRRPLAFDELRRRSHGLRQVKERDETVLICPMGPNAETLAACLRGVGLRAEALPQPDRETVRIGRRYTSGKECLPLCVTLGSVLQRLEKGRDRDERFALIMPTANGPCRFGAYATLDRLVLDQLGWRERVSLMSPADNDYFEGVAPGLSILILTGFAATDMLQAALYDARPAERRAGAASEAFEEFKEELLRTVERAAGGDLSLAPALLQVANGRLFGCAQILRRAAEAFAALKSDRPLPTVAVVGEIYVRCDPFSNDYVIERLERQGVRVRFAPMTDWLEYADYCTRAAGLNNGIAARLSTLTLKRILARTYGLMAARLGWPPRTSVPDSLRAAAPYIRKELEGEAVLTLGAPLHEWHEGAIDGVLSVGPLECMPTKIAEAQFFHVGEREGLCSLTIPVNGDPVDPAGIDSFAFEVKTRFARRVEDGSAEQAASE